MYIFTVGSEPDMMVVTAVSVGVLLLLLMVLGVVVFIIICYCYYKRRTNKQALSGQTQKRYHNYVAKLSYYKTELLIYKPIHLIGIKSWCSCNSGSDITKLCAAYIIIMMNHI